MVRKREGVGATGDAGMLVCAEGEGSWQSTPSESVPLPAHRLAASVVPSYPGEKRQSMFLTVGVPPPDQRLEQQEALLKEELARLVESGPTERELNRVKKGSRISLLEVIGQVAGCRWARRRSC